MLPRMGALLDVLGDWYIEAIEKAEASAPETQVGQISAGLVSRLATEPELDLPEDWRRELSELAGDRTLVLVAEAEMRRTNCSGCCAPSRSTSWNTGPSLNTTRRPSRRSRTG
jgi:hypothetical protein